MRKNVFVHGLEDKLTSPPVLVLPRSAGQYTVDPDVSDGQLGCALLQEQENKQLKPIGYWSRSFCRVERSYDTTHKECLAVVWLVLMLRPHLEGTHFIVLADDQVLRWILDLNECTGRPARWRLQLLEFDFLTVHRPADISKLRCSVKPPEGER